MVSSAQHRSLVGLQTADSAADILGVSRPHAVRILNELKRQEFVTVSGGNKKRFYKVTLRKQRPRNEGMYDWINKYNPLHIQVRPGKDHQVHGRYGPELALLDAIETRDFRIIRASLALYNHITDWSLLYDEAKKRDLWNKVGALHDMTRMFRKVRRMPSRYRRPSGITTEPILRVDYPTTNEESEAIGRFWNINVPWEPKAFDDEERHATV